MSHLELVLDCADPEALAAFWCKALLYRRVGSAGNYVLCTPEDHEGPHLLLQKVPEPKTAKNRMHMDIKSTDIELEAKRLMSFGATRLDEQPMEEHGSRWIRMTDPEGNEFCVCQA